MQYFNDSLEAFLGVGILGVISLASAALIVFCTIAERWPFLLP